MCWLTINYTFDKHIYDFIKGITRYVGTKEITCVKAPEMSFHLYADKQPQTLVIHRFLAHPTFPAFVHVALLLSVEIA